MKIPSIKLYEPDPAPPPSRPAVDGDPVPDRPAGLSDDIWSIVCLVYLCGDMKEAKRRLAGHPPARVHMASPLKPVR